MTTISLTVNLAAIPTEAASSLANGATASAFSEAFARAAADQAKTIGLDDDIAVDWYDEPARDSGRPGRNDDPALEQIWDTAYAAAFDAIGITNPGTPR